MALSKRLFLLTGALFALASLFLHGREAPVSQAASQDTALQDVAPASLRDGDLVFRSGTDAIAALVRAQTDASQFSHVGMLVRSGDAWMVIHAIPAEPGVAGGVLAEPLEQFTTPHVASKVGFFRVEGLSEPGRNELKHYLLSQVGKPFDYRFQSSDDDSHFCTELVVKAVRRAGIDLEPSLKRVQVLTMAESAIPPDILSRSPLLQQFRPRTAP